MSVSSAGKGIDRAVVIVLDGVGAGELPDAADYGDQGSNTLANTAKAVGGLKLPNFERLGLGSIIEIEGIKRVENPLASFGKMAQVSVGKDTTSGHLEMMGLPLMKAFPTYPFGFPSRVISKFEKMIGKRVICNRPGSGTEIIKEYGKEHLQTKRPIVYTSADSVFQIAAHKDVCGVEELYKMCNIARDILKGEDEVCRVIARPFAGVPGAFFRTDERRDFSLKPPGKTVLDYALLAGLKVFAVGKISGIFFGQGISESAYSRTNSEAILNLITLLSRQEKGIILTNLVDFDMLWGHRNDPKGFAAGLKAADDKLPKIMEALRPSDALFITADHGCDPTTESTDHSREYVPLLAYGKRLKAGCDLGVRGSLADLGKTIAELLGFEAQIFGKSFAQEITSPLNELGSP